MDKDLRGSLRKYLLSSNVCWSSSIFENISEWMRILLHQFSLNFAPEQQSEANESWTDIVSQHRVYASRTALCVDFDKPFMVYSGFIRGESLSEQTDDHKLFTPQLVKSILCSIEPRSLDGNVRERGREVGHFKLELVEPRPVVRLVSLDKNLIDGTACVERRRVEYQNSPCSVQLTWSYMNKTYHWVII